MSPHITETGVLAPSSIAETAMHPDLEPILAADEECRSRLNIAEDRRDRELATARAETASSVEARRAAARDALEQELQAIRSEGDARLRKLQEQQKTYLATLAKTGEAKFADAVQSYQRIVLGEEGTK